MAKILLVEDNPDMLESVREWLNLQNYATDTAARGNDAIDMIRSFEYDLLILDWDLPQVSGLEILKRYRGFNGTAPVLMLTGKNAVEEKTSAFEAGADDYLTKPFHPRELGARIKALLRRPRQIVTDELSVRGITLDLAARKAEKNGKSIALQPLELALLEFMMRHPNEVFSPEALLRRVWDSDQEVSIDAIYTCIRRIRRKIDAEGETSILRTVHGVGYCLDS